MTDRTQPHAGSTHIIRFALELGLLWVDGSGRNKVREALNALDALEAKLASVGAGGVQALSAAPAVPNGDELRRIARSARTSASDDASPTEYVLAGWKAAMLAASPTPPAEQPDLSQLTERGANAWAGVDAQTLRDGTYQQATTTEAVTPEGCATTGAASVVTPDAVYADKPDSVAWFATYGGDIFTSNQLLDFADRTYALRMQRAAPKAAPVVWLSSKQLRGVTALHGQYLPFRRQPEGRFDTPVYLEQAAPKAAPTWPSEALVWEALQAYLKHDTNMEGMRAALIVGAAPQQKARHLTQALTDPENQPNQYGVEFGMSGQQMHFKIGNQLFRLAYEPDDQQEFEFMKRMLIHAFSTFTPDVKTAPQPAPAPLSDDVVKDAAQRTNYAD